MYMAYNFAHGQKTPSRRNFSKILPEHIAPVQRLAAIKRRRNLFLWAKLCTWHITLPSQISWLLVKIFKFCFMVVVVWWSTTANNQVRSLGHNSLMHKTQLKSLTMKNPKSHLSIFSIFYFWSHITLPMLPTQFQKSPSIIAVTFLCNTMKEKLILINN